MTSIRTGRFLVACALLLLAGCAPLPATTTSPAVPPAGTRPAPGAVEPAREPARAAAALDSTPSPEALRVLARIPEPLTPAQQVPPPEASASHGRAVAPETAYDTLRAEAEPRADSASVPVPAPTQPLKSTPSPGLVMPDTLATPAAAAPEAPPGQAAEPPARAPAESEPCWKLQVAAPAESGKAESRRAAAQSLLVVPMVVEHEKGLYKVRTRDCMTREAAAALKKRAVESGFAGVFVVDAHAKPVTPARKPARRAVKRAHTR